jgi:Terminase RNaseH-like domain
VSRYAVFSTWDDSPHLSEEAKREMEATMLPHERDARMRGRPALGSGAIFPLDEADYVIPPAPVPAWWRRCAGFDLGWRMSAVIWIAVDPENDRCVVYDEWFRSEAEPEIHAAGILARGDWIPVVADPASRGRSQRDGQSLFDIYTSLGLNLRVANNGVESGLAAVWSRLSTGKLKVFSTCCHLLEEMRIYRRDEKHRVVKQRDHGCDALRYAIVSGLPIAAAKPSNQWLDSDIPRGARRSGFVANYDPLPMGNQTEEPYGSYMRNRYIDR